MLPTDFPSEEVFEAYLHPVVDESTELFEWGKPDLHSLRLYPLRLKNGILLNPLSSKPALGRQYPLADNFLFSHNLSAYDILYCYLRENTS